MKILITGGKSVQALKLAKDYPRDTIVLADYGEMPLFPSEKFTFLSLGQRNDAVIAHNLLSHCLDEAVNAILPLHIFEIEELAKASLLFEEFNIQVLMPAAGQVIQVIKS